MVFLVRDIVPIVIVVICGDFMWLHECHNASISWHCDCIESIFCFVLLLLLLLMFQVAQCRMVARHCVYCVVYCTVA